MWNLKNWLVAIAIAVLCVGLAACAAEAPMEEGGMEAEEPAGEAAAESAEPQEGEEGEDSDGGEGEDAGEGRVGV